MINIESGCCECFWAPVPSWIQLFKVFAHGKTLALFYNSGCLLAFKNKPKFRAESVLMSALYFYHLSGTSWFGKM